MNVAQHDAGAATGKGKGKAATPANAATDEKDDIEWQKVQAFRAQMENLRMVSRTRWQILDPRIMLTRIHPALRHALQ
jgi:hypothetical protein